MGKPFGSLSIEERDRLIQAHEDAYEIIVRSITKLKNRKYHAADGQERADIDARVADLIQEKTFLDARIAAVEAQNSLIRPPTNDQLEKLKKLLTAVEELNQNQAIVNEVVAITSAVAAIFKEVVNE